MSENLVVALGQVDTEEADFDSVKATCKAKIEQAQSQVQALSSALRAGFELRTKDCTVAFDVKARKKTITCVETEEVVAVEDMTADDLQTELQLAESVFEDRVETPLWVCGQDQGLLVIGSMNNRWYSAVRLSVGQHRLDERLDSEQRAYKKRDDAVNEAAKRAYKWLKDNFKEAAKGFEDNIAAAVAAQTK